MAVSLLIATSLSVMCSVVLISVYCFNPKWRSLHKFISIHQIVIGTLHLCISYMLQILDNITLEHPLVTLNGYLYLGSMCWSLCASVVAYFKLVLLFCDIGHEKTKASIFSYSALIIFKGISDSIVPLVYQLDDFMELLWTRAIVLYMVTTVNIFLFLTVVRAVLPCSPTMIPQRRANRVVALIGAAILSDIIMSIDLFTLLLVVNGYALTFSSWFSHIFHFRLIPQTILVLFNKASRNYWKKRYRIRASNNFNQTCL